MSAIAGRVLILPKGDYNASVTYEFLDLVNHNSSSWLAKKASQGVEPSDANAGFWQKFGSSVTPDGVTIVMDENGVISAVGGTADEVTYENESFADVTNVKEALDVILESVAIGEDNAGYHNSVYRGKYLGDTVTGEQYEAISSGTFDDLFIGDYWTIDGVNWRIAAFDYYLNTGDTAFVQHHAVIVPDTVLYDYVMNDTNTTASGYVGSKMYTEGLEQAKTAIKSAFSGHVLSHRIYLVNAVTSGYASGCAWLDSEVDLMNEQMLYGSGIFLPIANGSVVYKNNHTEKSQLNLFTYRHDIISNGTSFWLRDVVSDSNFAITSGGGNAQSSPASESYGVRPYFCIG